MCVRTSIKKNKISQRHITSQDHRPNPVFLRTYCRRPERTVDVNHRILFMSRKSRETSVPKRTHTNTYPVSYNTHHDSIYELFLSKHHSSLRLSMIGRPDRDAPTSMTQPNCPLQAPAARIEHMGPFPRRETKNAPPEAARQNKTLPIHHW